MSTIPQFLSLLTAKGSDVQFKRDESTIPCPCRTPEGYRDPIWHLQHPAAVMCNESGMLPGVGVNMTVKAFMQPIQSTRATRLSTEQLIQMFGEIQADDHLGIFPFTWANQQLNFRDWGRAGEDYLIYNGEKFTVVNANLIPDPDDGNPAHHWEIGARLIESTSPS
jgi:hypothetical protein